MTRIHHLIARFSPQGLQCNSKVQLCRSLIECISLDLQNLKIRAWAYTFSGGSSEADDSVEPENRVWKQLLMRRAEKSKRQRCVMISQTNDVTQELVSLCLTCCLVSLDDDRWTGCGTGVQTD